MEAAQATVVRLELPVDLVSVLQSIAEKQGLVKEQVAREAIELWVERYRKFGPAFSRSTNGAN